MNHAPARRSRLRPRRGMTVIVVLSLISITLALSYAIMRSQSAALQIQLNGQRQTAAKASAMAGLSVALHKMTESGWAGVGTSLSGTLGPHEEYEVTYTAGDASLTSSSPNYADYPFRVTVTATGYAADPSNPSLSASTKVQAVVRLRPRNLSARPSEWSTLVQHTLYQLSSMDVTMDVPARVEGPVRLQGSLKLGTALLWSAASKGRFLTDLNALRLANLGDYRPFTGPIKLPYSDNDATSRALLTANLQLSVSDIAKVSASADLSHPGSLSTYRLYPGGPTYDVAPVAATLQNTTLAPNPLTNPLGLFYRAGDLTLKSNVNIQGLLVVTGNVIVQGSNVHLTPAQLPAVEGSSAPVEMPTILAGGDIQFQSAAAGTFDGLIGAWGHLDFDPRVQNLELRLAGRVFAQQFTLGQRTEWNLSSLVWGLWYTLFNNQLTSSTPIVYFPAWLFVIGLDPTPRLTIVPEATAVNYHWLKKNHAVYQPATADGALRWELLDWKESP